MMALCGPVVLLCNLPRCAIDFLSLVRSEFHQAHLKVNFWPGGYIGICVCAACVIKLVILSTALFNVVGESVSIPRMLLGLLEN